MAKRIQVTTQEEFDACVTAGNVAVVSTGHFVARGNSSVEAWGNSSVEAWDNSSVEARENSSVVARGNSSVEARGNSSVVAWGNSSVEARDNSSVVAWGSVFVRLFGARAVTASSHVVVMIHGRAAALNGGRQVPAAPVPVTGREWAEYYGIKPDAPFKVDGIDAKILAAIEAGLGRLDMGSWHGGDDCDETNWCGTSHCRAGYAICLAGEAGFALERKYGPEVAGRMIYAVSRPDAPVPDFFADTETALADIRASAGEAGRRG